MQSLQESRIDENSGDSLMSTYWHVLARGTVGDPFNVFYRLTSVNGAYAIQLKMMNAGRKIVIAKNAQLQLLLDNDRKLVLYNKEYRNSCKGCGARGLIGSDAHGVTVTYPIGSKDMAMLQYAYLEYVKVYSAEGYWLKRISERNSDIFIDQARLMLNTGITR